MLHWNILVSFFLKFQDDEWDTICILYTMYIFI